MKKSYSNFLNLLDIREEGSKRLFKILHFTLFILLIYWFFNNYQPSDFWLMSYIKHDNGSPLFSERHNVWNTYKGWRSYGEWLWVLFKFFWVFLFILIFTFGIPVLFHKTYHFSKTLGVKEKRTQLYVIICKTLGFGLFFWLFWFQFEYTPFERIEFNTKTIIQDSYLPHPSINKGNYVRVYSFTASDIESNFFYYRTKNNSKFFYDFLLLFIPFLISFMSCSVIVKLILWVRDGYKKN